MSRKKLLILITICIIIIILAVISIPLIIDSQKTATLNLFVIPEQSKILINGEEYKNGNYKFFPGEVEISISKDGFETKTFTEKLKPNETTLIYKLLSCSDSSLFCYLEDDNNLDYNLIPYIAHYSDDETKVLNFYNTTSIRNILPFRYNSTEEDVSYNFMIQYIGIKNNKMEIEIEDNVGNGEKLAKKIITESGYDPNNYIINYVYRIYER